MINKSHFRASGWLLVAAAVAFIIGVWMGGTAYLASWVGACGKEASAAFGCYWIGRNVCKIDPSARDTPLERGVDKLAMAIIIAAGMIAVCLAV